MPRPFAFDRKKRLVAKSDFDRAFRAGSRARGAIVLVVARANGLAHSRLGLSVGKVIWKGAVQRNRVRRIFREAFRLSYPDLPVGYDFVLVPGAPKLEPELQATRAELVKLARKAAARCAEKLAAGGAGAADGSKVAPGSPRAPERPRSDAAEGPAASPRARQEPGEASRSSGASAAPDRNPAPRPRGPSDARGEASP